MLLICLDNDDQIPNRWGSSSCFGWFYSLVHLITSYPLSQYCFLLPHPKLNQWKTQVKLLLWYQVSKLSVSITLSHRFNLSVGLTASRICREARSWISTIIDCQTLWQDRWCQPSPRYWRVTEEEYLEWSTSQVDKQMVSWTSHA